MFVLLEKWRGDQIDLSHQKKTTLKSPVLLGLTKYGCHLVFSELLAAEILYCQNMLVIFFRNADRQKFFQQNMPVIQFFQNC